MARSEIDDIFAAKKTTAKPVASTSTSADVTDSKKKKKNKKRKLQAEEVQDPGVNEERPRKKRAVETVLDPSIALPSSSSSRASQAGKGASTTRARAPKKEKEGLDRFKDSRGTGPRKLKIPCYNATVVLKKH